MNKIKSYRILSIIMLLIVLIDSGLCIFSIHVTKREVANMEQIVNNNILENECLSEFEKASEYLSTQAREFIRTYKPIYMEKYFEELDGVKRREAALQKFEEAGTVDIEKRLMRDAMEKSNELAETEIHAMAIVAKLIGYDENNLPQQIKDYEFSNIENASDVGTLKTIARNILYGNSYESKRKEVVSYINRAEDLIKLYTNQESEDAVKNTNNAITMLNTYIIILLVVVGLLFGLVLMGDRLPMAPKEK